MGNELPYKIIYLPEPKDKLTEVGWYVYDVEYPEEGMIGPYETKDEAEADAKQAYEVTTDGEA